MSNHDTPTFVIPTSSGDHLPAPNLVAQGEQHSSADMEGSTSPHILATSTASGVTMRRNPQQAGNGSSSGSSASDEALLEKDRQILHLQQQHLHLQQQLAQTLQAFDHVQNLGFSPSLPPLGRAQPFMQPFMTDRVHMSNNGAPVSLNYDQSQLANSGMTNGTAYHSSVSAVPAMFSQSTQQVLNSQESNTILHATQQPGMPHYGSNNFSAANSWHGSNACGVQSPSGGQFSMSFGRVVTLGLS